MQSWKQSGDVMEKEDIQLLKNFVVDRTCSKTDSTPCIGLLYVTRVSQAWGR